jgi:hypothetical protein
MRILFLSFLACSFLVQTAHSQTCSQPTTAYFPSSDCTKFYQCVHQVLYTFNCPAGTLFNVNNFACDWPYNVNCQATSASTTKTTTTTTTTTRTTTTTTTTTTKSSSTTLTTSLNFFCQV